MDPDDFDQASDIKSQKDLHFPYSMIVRRDWVQGATW